MEKEGFPGSFLEPRCLWPAIKIDWEPFGGLELSGEEGGGHRDHSQDLSPRGREMAAYNPQ